MEDQQRKVAALEQLLSCTDEQQQAAVMLKLAADITDDITDAGTVCSGSLHMKSYQYWLLSN